MSEKKEGPDNIPPSPAVNNLVNQGVDAAKKVLPLDPAQELTLQHGLTNVMQNILQPQQGGPDATPQPGLEQALGAGMKKFFDGMKPESPKPGAAKSSNENEQENSQDPVKQLVQGLQKALDSVVQNFLHPQPGGPSFGGGGGGGGASPSPSPSPSPSHGMPSMHDASTALKAVPVPQAQEAAAGLKMAEEAQKMQNGFAGPKPKPGGVPSVDMQPAAPEPQQAAPEAAHKSKSPFNINMELKPPGMGE